MIGWALTKMYRSGDMDTAGKISMERSAEIPAEELSEKYVKRSEETSAEVPPAICPEKTKYALMRLSDALQREIKDGKVYSSSAECLDFGMYPQNYGNNAWGALISGCIRRTTETTRGGRVRFWRSSPHC